MAANKFTSEELLRIASVMAETLGELTQQRLFQRVLLRELIQSDVGWFIEVVTGATPPSGPTQAVYTETEGNPLFVTD